MASPGGPIRIGTQRGFSNNEEVASQPGHLFLFGCVSSHVSNTGVSELAVKARCYVLEALGLHGFGCSYSILPLCGKVAMDIMNGSGCVQSTLI